MKKESVCYIIQDTDSMMILGCFKTRKDAEKYVNNNQKLFIIKTPISYYENVLQP